MTELMARKHSRAKKPNVEEESLHFQRTANKKLAQTPDQVIEQVPADDAAGIGGNNTVNTNEAILTTETASASQTQRYIMSSSYGAVAPPERMSDGTYRCQDCSEVFESLEAHDKHYRKAHSDANAVVEELP